MIVEQPATELASSIDEVHRRIASACRRADRDPGTVTLVAVTKTVGRAAIAAGYTAGLRDFGESRVQDARSKYQPPLPGDAKLHMIGNLQSNKARVAVDLFDLIHSVDRASLVDELAKQAERLNRIVNILLEVNISGETQKAGCPVDKLPELLRFATSQPGLQVDGLMTMAPLVVDAEDVRPVFRGLANVARQIEQSHGERLPILSMGMTNDFEIAVEEGATHVRIGRAIFGEG